MDHPLFSNDQAPLRKRMVHFIKSGLSVQRSSNIIFLCGGNDPRHMRPTFLEYCEKKLPGYDVFLPEYAMDTIFSDEPDDQFDLADFEEMVGAISYAIVVFPEAPGSFAETGYFSAVPNISRKCIVVMDSNRQHKDSFLSLGPAKKISEKSAFHPNINLNYVEPNFDQVIKRIESRRSHKTKKNLKVDKFSDLSYFEIAALIHTTIRFCRIATLQDVEYLFRAIFKNQFAPKKVKRLLSILVGSKHLLSIGTYGHFCANPKKSNLTSVRDGFKSKEAELNLSVAALCSKGELEFLEVLQERSNAH